MRFRKGCSAYNMANESCWVAACLFLVVTIALLSTTLRAANAESSPGPPQTTTAAPQSSQASSNAPSSTTSTTTTTTSKGPEITASSSSTTTTSSTTNKPELEKNREEIKKIIVAHAVNGRNRLKVNRPAMIQTSVDFAPSSQEARVAEATSQLGLRFMSSLEFGNKDNVVISPLSLQNLLSMVLLGSGDKSSTADELAKVLGYEQVGLLAPPVDSANRLTPHQALRSVFQSILDATHLNLQPDNLLNVNPGAVQQEEQQEGLLRAQLQTSQRDGDIPLEGQLNFTLANLVLTNQDRVKLAEKYEEELQSLYDVKLEEFSRENTSVSGKEMLPLHVRVNNWVAEKTRNQIQELAKPDDLSDPDLAMVLLNAAHFKGRWLHTFASRATHDSPFYNEGLDKEAKSVKFMRQKSPFGYADFGTASLENEALANKYWQALEGVSKQTEDAETVLTEDATGNAPSRTTTKATTTTTKRDVSPEPDSSLTAEEKVIWAREVRRNELTSKLNCSALMLPFSLNDGQELSMVILLPAKRDGLKELQNALDGETLNAVYRSFSQQIVQVEMPKFAFEASYDAKSILQKMGLHDVFDERADLGRMFTSSGSKVGNGQLKSGVGHAKVDKVIHKAKILVDESGAEAAAASMATVMMRNSIRPPAPKFIADHPFLFVIKHNGSNMPLFMGCVNKL